MTLPLDTPLRLKPEAAAVYALAPAGAIAYARRRKSDEGFPMVYIEWDKSHWTYEGEQDKWTFENHFEPVTEENSTMTESNLPPELQASIEAAFAAYTGQSEKTKVEESAPASELYDLDTPEHYAALAKSAGEHAAEGNAFILLGIKETEIENEKVYVPFLLQSYQNEIAGLFLETQLGEYVTQAFRNSAVELIRQLKDNDTQQSKTSPESGA